MAFSCFIVCVLCILYILFVLQKCSRKYTLVPIAVFQIQRIQMEGVCQGLRLHTQKDHSIPPNGEWDGREIQPDSEANHSHVWALNQCITSLNT